MEEEGYQKKIGQVNNSDLIMTDQVGSIRSSEGGQFGKQNNEVERYAMLSPRPGNDQYQRLKYYSALKTGYQHLARESIRDSFLKIPDHILMSNPFMIIDPLSSVDENKDKKNSSIIIIFSCWKTMIGTAVVSLPWAYQQSGLVLGLIITVVSFITSLYTCILIVKCTGDDPDFSDTARKYYGTFGFYTALLCPAILIMTAVIVYYVLLCQSLYPILLAIYALCSGTNPDQELQPVWSTFSTRYCAIILFPILVWLCCKKDLSIFMRIGSFGIVFVIFIMLFIVGCGILAFTDTKFSFGHYQDSIDWNANTRVLVLWYKNFAPLAGILCTGFFLHTCSLPILRSAANPENNIRDLTWGYFLVMISYMLCGVLGYIGFTGFSFKNYYLLLTDPNLKGQIAQNCLGMFANYQNVWALLLRIALFMLLFSTYPLVHYFLNTMLHQLFWQKSKITRKAEIILNIMLTTIPLLFAMFYQQVGTILGYAGASSGYLIIFVLPPMIHLKRLRTSIENPLLAEALEMNNYNSQAQGDKSPQIIISDELIQRRAELNKKNGVRQEVNLKPYYIQCVTHSLIPIYGTLVLFFSFYKFQ